VDGDVWYRVATPYTSSAAGATGVGVEVMADVGVVKGVEVGVEGVEGVEVVVVCVIVFAPTRCGLVPM
jgi:hypothetical protein